MTQAAWIVPLGMAEVFVLLLGEIDLSIGYTSVIGATLTWWLLEPPDPPRGRWRCWSAWPSRRCSARSRA